jgi:hypothetical protein
VSKAPNPGQKLIHYRSPKLCKSSESFPLSTPQANRPNRSHLSISESATAAPNWKGPPSDKSHVNSIDPFGGGVSVHQPSSGGVKLSAGAPNFEPASFTSKAVIPKRSHLAILNRYSVQDHDEPTIVQSSVDGNGKHAGLKTPQQPIGTRTASYSPVTKVFFTTDMGPGVPFIGGHYIKIDRVAVANIHSGMGALYDDVS